MKRLADRFALEREIGSGGMARVFLGRDEVLDRPVAVKVLKPAHGETEIAARFRREGRTAARLSHPNIVRVYDAGEGDLEGSEVSYIVMEYLSGGDLKELIDARGPLPGAELARIGEEVCSGLAHAHGRGVVHRDIKPHNILLDEKGRAKVSDFGIARALDTTQATRTGAYLGTALYSSPEQLQGHRVTPKSDVYSLGATLYQAAAGEPPFTGTPIEVASQHVSKPPPPITAREADLDVGGDLEALILACLAKDADDRPSAEEAQKRFGELALTSRNVPPVAPPEPEKPRRATRGRRGPRRRGLAAVLLPLLALLAVLGVVGAFFLAGPFGGSGETAGQDGPQQNRQAAAGAQNDGNAGAANTPQPTTPAPRQTPPPEGGQGGEQTRAEAPGSSSGESADQTLEDFYQTAAGDDYQSSWDYLTPQYQQTFGSRGALTNQFRTLERIEFTEGPTITQSDGNTATVAASTIAYHTNRIDRRTGTADLVKVGDEWKISGLNFVEA